MSVSSLIVPDGAGARPYRVKPLSLGEMLDHALYLVRDNFRIILLSLAVFTLPVHAVLVVIAILLGFGDVTMSIWEDTMSDGEFAFNIFSIVSGLFLFLISAPLTSAAMLYGMGLAYLGQAPSFGECARAALRLWPFMIVANVMITVLSGIGMMLCLIPGVVLYIFMFLVPPIVVLERANPIEAISRSFSLMKDSFAKVFVLSLVMFAIWWPMGMAPALIPNALIYFILSAVSGAVYAGLIAAVQIAVYCSARCQVEHMDLDLLAGQIDVPVVQEASL